MTNPFTLSPQLLVSPGYQAQWHLHGRTSDGSTCCSVKAEQAWTRLRGFGNEEIVIAFSDDGCHTDAVAPSSSCKFAAAAYLEQGELVYGNPQEVKEKMVIPGHRHGTALAGLIAGPLDVVLPIGVAPGCRLLPVRWEYKDRFRITQKGFNTILTTLADKVDIFINTWASLPNMIFSEDNVRLIQELSYSGGRRGKGIIFIWAAGNSGCPIHYEASSLIPYTGYVENGSFYSGRFASTFFHSLCHLENVLIVSAINQQGRRAHYSCYGPGITLCAPSNNSHCFDAYTFSEPGLTTRSGDIKGYTHNFKGTSGASALVAGVAALTLSANQNLSASELANILRKTAAKDLDFRPYPEHRYPCQNFDGKDVSDLPLRQFNSGEFNHQGWSPWFGYGLVDAEKAVNLALSKARAL